ncbi:MAG: hypothetical protein RI924_1030 [Bacteroidota bacterium]|jgi:hypothetical protein
MKKVILAFGVLMLLGLACKKDNTLPKKAFEDISLTDIQQFENKFSANPIIVSDDAGNQLLKPGSIIFYKTQIGTLGKMRIVSISDQKLLTIDVVNFNAAGNVILNKSGSTVQPTWLCDLDMGVQTNDFTLREFDWDMYNAFKKGITPKNTAVFYVYSK